MKRCALRIERAVSGPRTSRTVSRLELLADITHNNHTVNIIIITIIIAEPRSNIRTQSSAHLQGIQTPIVCVLPCESSKPPKVLHNSLRAIPQKIFSLFFFKITPIHCFPLTPHRYTGLGSLGKSTQIFLNSNGHAWVFLSSVGDTLTTSKQCFIRYCSAGVDASR